MKVSLRRRKIKARVGRVGHFPLLEQWKALTLEPTNRFFIEQIGSVARKGGNQGCNGGLMDNTFGGSLKTEALIAKINTGLRLLSTSARREDFVAHCLVDGF